MSLTNRESRSSVGRGWTGNKLEFAVPHSAAFFGLKGIFEPLNHLDPSFILVAAHSNVAAVPVAGTVEKNLTYGYFFCFSVCWSVNRLIRRMLRGRR